MRLACLAAASFFLLACSAESGTDASTPLPDAGVDLGRFDLGFVDAGPRTDGGPPSDPCAPNPCREANRGVCSATMGFAECRCDAGFELRGGQCERVTSCTPDTCSGHGDCSAGPTGPVCACTLGYAGAFCAQCDTGRGYYEAGGVCTLDACTPNPCSAPDRMRCTVVAQRAECGCNAGTHDVGGVCVADDTCTPTSCSGHGACTATAGMTSCVCEAGFGGARCDTCADGFHADGAGGCTTDPCLPNPCTAPSRSVCTSDMGMYACGCVPGTHLEGDACVVDEVCTPTTCSGHGTCTVAGGRSACACAAGFAGARCDTCAMGFHDDGAGGCTNDPCLPNVCTRPLQTVCVAMGTTATCTCVAGAHPDGAGGCTNDPCLPDPCAAMNLACRAVGTTAQCFMPACDDGNPCTDDSTVGGRCTNVRKANGSTCTTGICRVSETCTDGVCGGGSARVCNDGNPCTRDTCVAPAGCTSSNDDTLVPPDDTVPCTTARCSAGASQQVPTNAVCDDGRYCTGEDVCMPGATADARGCIVRNVPVAPGPSTPCRSYACDDATRSFLLTTRATGAACNDGIACTSGDVCDAQSVCSGTLTPACDPPGASCTPGGPLSLSVDVGVAPITGRITLNGAALPTTTPYYDNAVLWAQARDTGKRHRIAIVDYTRNGSYPNYMRSAGADQYRTMLVPGIYDILYQRGYQSSSEYVTERTQTPSADPVVNGYRLLLSGVIIPSGGRTLDLDVGATVVTGVITQNGAALPTTTPYYDNAVLWARAQDTGKLHRLAIVDYTRNGSYPNYMRSATSDQIRTMLIPGTYDILYQRGYQSSADYVTERTQTPSQDAVVNGYRLIRAGVVITGASQTLNVDVGATVVTGVITQGGATLPMTTPYYDNAVIWARAQDTGKLHRLAIVDYTRNGSYPNYMRSAASDQLRTMLVPGTYDILYQRGYQSSADYVTERTQSPSSDPVVNGYRVLQTGVVITGASQTLNVDVGATVVTGLITQGGATLPTTTPYYDNAVLWARARDTGKLHRLAIVDYTRNGAYPNYMRSATSDQIRTMLVPGAYDLLYQRGYQSSSEYVTERTLTPSVDPVVNGYRVLRENVVVSGASQTLDVDVGVTVVTGLITQNGATLPMTTNLYDNAVVWARARDTGKLHRLAVVDYTRNGSYPNYMRSATSDQIRTMLVPGAYDILYQRAYQSSSEYVSEQAFTTTPGWDPVVNGYRVVQENVVVTGAMQTLNVDVRSVLLQGSITMNGATLPTTTPYYDNAVLWLRARDTGKLHRVAIVDYTRNGSYPNYMRSPGSNLFRTTAIPGAYDLVYQRGYQSSSDYVTEQTLTPSVDNVVNGYRLLQACVLVQ